MYPTPIGQPFTIHLAVTGSGVFDGATEFGRAKATLPNGDANAVVRCSALLYGTGPNAIQVQLVDDGAGVVRTATVVQQTGSLIQVRLRRDLSGVLATSHEVAAAINAVSPRLPIRATANGTGSGIVSAVSATSLSGGADPKLDPAGYQFNWAVTTNNNGGLFWFEQDDPLYIRTIAGVFTGVVSPITMTIERVPLNENLEPVGSQAIPIIDAVSITSSNPKFSITDVHELVQPYQAIRVTCPAAGYVVLDVHKTTRYPFL